MKGQKSNLFINIIYEKNPLSNIFMKFIHKWKVKRFKQSLSKSSPDFNMLWSMADFIKLAEELFFYNNISSVCDDTIGLYSSRSYKLNENGFKLCTSEYTLVIKLYGNSRRTVLELERNTNVLLKSKLSFKNNEWEEEPNVDSEILLEILIRDIIKHILNLFDFCYDRR